MDIKLPCEPKYICRTRCNRLHGELNAFTCNCCSRKLNRMIDWLLVMYATDKAGSSWYGGCPDTVLFAPAGRTLRRPPNRKRGAFFLASQVSVSASPLWGRVL